MKADYSGSGVGDVHAVAPQADGGAGQTKAQEEAEVLAAIDEALKEG